MSHACPFLKRDEPAIPAQYLTLLDPDHVPSDTIDELAVKLS